MFASLHGSRCVFVSSSRAKEWLARVKSPAAVSSCAVIAPAPRAPRDRPGLGVTPAHQVVLAAIYPANVAIQAHAVDPAPMVLMAIPLRRGRPALRVELAQKVL